MSKSTLYTVLTVVWMVSALLSDSSVWAACFVVCGVVCGCTSEVLGKIEKDAAK